LFGVALYAGVLAVPEELARIRADAVATIFYVANWHSIVAGNEYWELFRAPSPLEHTWSLAIEEQFYLVWPLLLLLLRGRFRISMPTLAVAAAALALGSALWMAWLFDPSGGNRAGLLWG
jgi:peptidoglycan/LPS O-acetylase OafA/YrhL